MTTLISKNCNGFGTSSSLITKMKFDKIDDENSSPLLKTNNNILPMNLSEATQMHHRGIKKENHDQDDQNGRSTTVSSLKSAFELKNIDKDGDDDDNLSQSKSDTIIDGQIQEPYRMKIVWRNVFAMSALHLGALYGVYLYFFYAKYQTLFMQSILVYLLGLGITCGAHRLWAHRSYEASLTLRIILMLLNSASLQNDIYEWSRDHRVHHKFSETDADPHNSKRGFFFAHMGWLLCRKHPDVIRKGRTVSMADLEQDQVVRFQRQFYKPLAVILTFLVPTWIAYYGWNEDYYVAFFMTLARYTFSLHATWLVNSAAHLYGKKPYDTRICPVESSLVEWFSFGEGYHNYHHVFPFDYSASEMSWTHNLNFSTYFIDCCAWLGLAWNLKKVDHQTVMKRVRRTGDLEMVSIHHQQQQYSRWKHTILPVLFVITLPTCGIWIFRHVVSWIYWYYTGIPNRWI